MPGRDIYALLVGIDAYPAPIPQLQGCKNDIHAIEDLLRHRVAVGQDRLHLMTLLDEEATRESVIRGFRDHLAKAATGDVALFYYSGHGSQEPAPEEWWNLEPDHLDETLVLYDSRTQDGWDLADKELACLLDGIDAGEPHVLVVLDCCHSGSGTRAALEDGTAERRAPMDRRKRPLTSFLFAPEKVQDIVQPLGQRGVMGDSGWGLPRAKHILLSGCRANETSKEIAVDGQPRGAMTLALQRALSNAGTRGTYRDVHRQVSSNVRSTVRNQHPQLETSSATDLDGQFLGGAMDGIPGSFVLTHAMGGWVLDGGRVHGLSGPIGGESTVFDVRTHDGALSMARVSITSVSAGEATVEVTDGALDESATYRAVVVSAPLPPLAILVEGNLNGVRALRAALHARNRSGPLLVEMVTAGQPATIWVRAEKSGYSLRRADGESPLCPRAKDAEGAVKSLEHFASWIRLRDLSNPATQLPADAVTMTVNPKSQPGGPEPWQVDGQYRFTYDTGGVPPRPRAYVVTLTNHSDRPLWVSLVDLTDTYGIFIDAIPGGAQELAAGESTLLDLDAVVPDELWEQGVSEATDVLKLLVSTEEFDPRTLSQDDLDVSADFRTRTARPAPSSAFDTLLNRVVTRRARPPGLGDETPDWFTRDITVTSVRPLLEVQVSPDNDQDVVPGLQVARHPTFSGNLRVTSAGDATRDLDAAPVPPALNESSPFSFVATREVAGETDALVVSTDLDGALKVTESQPLVLRSTQALVAGEHVLPFAWDGEFYVPLGFSRPTESGCDIVLERLPEPISTTRSLGGSIRIMFRKLVGKKFGLSYDYPLLRLASIDAQGVVTYEKDRNTVKQAVQHAATVLLYVHGIIGDSMGMASSAVLSGSARPLHDAYDAILTFDYENLNTSIEENATLLVSRLAGVGLAGGHDKQLDMVAHSMGGLVSRYMIEFLDGPSVNRLVTLGTPNAGSPWPTVQKWATAGVAFAINALTSVAWPAQVLGSMLGLVEKVDNALDQMEPGSPFLRRLAQGTDPKVPYDVIVGDRSLVDTARATSLLGRLSPSRIASEVIDLAFLREPNDLAVAVTSARDLPSGRNPAPKCHVVASDHVTFFSTQVSLDTLAEVLLN